MMIKGIEVEFSASQVDEKLQEINDKCYGR